MTQPSRRAFLSTACAAMAGSSTFAATLRRALDTPAHHRSGTIADLGHVIFLMQENRSFDSYFGTLCGVRGYSDPRPIPLPGGQPVWAQPHGSGHVLPYHFDIRNTNALRVGLDHSWKGSEATWKDWNAWVARKTVRTMGHFDRSDLPFYYALADAFTVCDAYHCSVFGPTDPNRFYALSGHVTGIPDARLYNVNNGTYNADIANDAPSARGIEWRSHAELLEANGISWKVYQEWDNYGDNYLQYFRSFRVDASGRPLTPDSALYRRGRAMAPGSNATNAAGTTGQWLIDDFAADVAAGRLPAVSWICAPTEYCEHPDQTPNAGEHFTARLLQALVAHPEVWSRTALILTYDENDGFFDHMPPAVPPLGVARGRTTLGNATQGEVHGSEPIGLGPRVPALVVSPWSKGGRVCSQLFDHTSLLRLLETWLVHGRGLEPARVRCDAISPWRRAVCGDLTQAFDFAAPPAGFPGSVPRSAVYFKGWGSRDALPPARQALPRQERSASGRPRPAMPLTYRCQLHGTALPASQFALDFGNAAAAGTPAAAYIVYSTLRSDGPWHYTVEAGKRIEREVWNWSTPAYHLAVHSHNGFLREFRGNLASAAARAEVGLEEDAAARVVRLSFINGGAGTCRFRCVDNAYGDRTVLSIDVPPGQTRVQPRDVSPSHGWYDLVVTVDGDPSYQRRLAGHLEGAGLDATDPVLNGLASVTWSPPPVLPPTPPAAASLRLQSERIRAGQAAQVQWQGLPPGSRHWIGVYRKGQTPGVQGSLAWNYLASAAGSQAVAGLQEGEYFIGLFLDDGYAEAAPRAALRVLAAGDLDANGAVDAADREALRQALASCTGQARFEPLADFDADGCVTQADYRAWYQAYGGAR